MAIRLFALRRARMAQHLPPFGLMPFSSKGSSRFVRVALLTCLRTALSWMARSWTTPVRWRNKQVVVLLLESLPDVGRPSALRRDNATAQRKPLARCRSLTGRNRKSLRASLGDRVEFDSDRFVRRALLTRALCWFWPGGTTDCVRAVVGLCDCIGCLPPTCCSDYGRQQEEYQDGNMGYDNMTEVRIGAALACTRKPWSSFGRLMLLCGRAPRVEQEMGDFLRDEQPKSPEAGGGGAGGDGDAELKVMEVRAEAAADVACLTRVLVVVLVMAHRLDGAVRAGVYAQ